MARIVDVRVMTKHLDTARQAINTARLYKETFRDQGKPLFQEMVNYALQRAEEQIAMAELYIAE